jgi:hypothetical protein
LVRFRASFPREGSTSTRKVHRRAFCNCSEAPSALEIHKTRINCELSFLCLLPQQAAALLLAQRTALKIIAAASAQRNGDVYARYRQKRRRIRTRLTACKTLAKVKERLLPRPVDYLINVKAQHLSYMPRTHRSSFKHSRQTARSSSDQSALAITHRSGGLEHCILAAVHR